MNLYEELKWRGIVKDITSPDLIDKLNNEEITFYIGTDPTADSMHIGHFSSFLIATRLAKAGHHPILLVGGATGRVGDPKPDVEREKKSEEEIQKNIDGLKRQAEKIFGFEVVDNYDWTKNVSFLDFLRDTGKYFNINYMINKDIIKRRLDTGISYTEFSYMLLQANDFLHLYNEKNCVLQVAGSDQWGNITSGVELIRKKTGKEAYGMVMPLVTDSQGVKFGKSEGNALWLDINKTSAYELYQFFINVEDVKVIDYLKIFTFLSKDEIEALEVSNNEAPHKREAHKALASEVIKFLHGEEELAKAISISESLFSGDIKALDLDTIKVAFKGVPSFKIETEENIVDFLVNNKVCSSKREAREFVNAGSILLNGEKITDTDFIVDKSVAIEESAVVIRRGKKKYFMGMFE